jgi:predicted ester cyclase
MSMNERQSLKELYRTYVEDVWNNHNIANAGKYIAEDIVAHGNPPGLPPGLEGCLFAFHHMQTAFPDWHIDILFQVEEGDMVVSHLRTSGTHRDTFFGIPATGKQFVSTNTQIIRYKEGKMVEQWSNADDLGMMAQLGVIQMPGQ